jgi:hypothetical protein
MTTLNINLNTEQFISLFQQFTKKEQVKIAEKIQNLTFAQQWKMLDEDLPDVEMSEDEIMQEIYAVRNEKN